MKKYFLLLTFLLSITSSRGDAPLPPPKDYIFSSRNNVFEVEMKYKSKATKIYKKIGGVKKLYWKMPGWFRPAFISDDGNTLVTCYSGVNLVPLDVTPKEEMVQFYDKGKLIKSFKLKDIVSTLSDLERTASHYYWGSCQGFNEKGEFLVDTAKSQLIFSVKNRKVEKVSR